MNRAQGSEIGAAESSLITTDAYAYCRHPVTLGFAFATPGFALVFDFVPLLINTILFTPIMIALVFYEERELVKRFGDEYISYQKRVPMLIPRRRNP
jgi:protein-S-isoprenylcysteine O-methyltransferase Ste14